MPAAVQRHRPDRAEVLAAQVVVAMPRLLFALLRIAQLRTSRLRGKPAVRHALDAGL